MLMAGRWHALGRERPDHQGEPRHNEDRQKIMLAVLVALQEERDRQQERAAAEQAEQPSAEVTVADRAGADAVGET
jgi:hypothetical protein